VTARVQPSGVQRLVGFDTAGEPFISDGHIYRGIYRGHGEKILRVLKICEENNLFAHGIVPTRALDANPLPEYDYELVLEHERIPFVTYPHEWSASMFKEAALLHIALFERLEEHGLTLKDWSPQNILFAGTRPVFVDFASIIPVEDLPSQIHLRNAKAPVFFGDRWDAVSKAMHELYRRMFEPYFGLPLVMMDRGHHARARTRIYETTTNAAETVIMPGEVFGESLFARLRYELEKLMNRIALLEKGPAKPKFFRRVRRWIASQDAALKGSDYATYYEDKNEAFGVTPSADWTNKQHGVHGALTSLNPASVLDLGSNTGWFSMLAAKLGSSVVAVDLDEASIDRLFGDARREQVEILPLVANLIRPLPPLAPRLYEDEPSLSLIGQANNLVTSPVERLKCEMVLALAIVHHLALGQGHSFDDIAAIFDDLSTKYLCVEFVELNDLMITSDPGFFPAYQENREAFGWYDRETFKAALKPHFPIIEEVPSHPDTRTLLICRKS
jgi:SAM-dependent methyltransferase